MRSLGEPLHPQTNTAATPSPGAVQKPLAADGEPKGSTGRCRPLPQSASFNSLHQHERMVTSPAVSPHSPPLGPGRWPNPRAPLTPLPAPSLQNYQLHSGELNGGLPSVSGFSSASTPYGVSSHTPPISGTDTMMGTCSPHSTPYCHTGSKLESPNIRAGGGCICVPACC